ncbi:hypothetical protein QR680_011030 [Steinernema hermaphroditum]|uniref:Uncharacterized protein n=1 Tax=Steinernema hermaphroditum TaxID=289476 RepID=A0AA39MCS5_9BILA|nr:hypothetical protein QR680_011030 [Steinernema hermaphroditum]
MGCIVLGFALLLGSVAYSIHPELRGNLINFAAEGKPQSPMLVLSDINCPLWTERIPLCDAMCTADGLKPITVVFGRHLCPWTTTLSNGERITGKDSGKMTELIGGKEYSLESKDCFSGLLCIVMLCN